MANLNWQAQNENGDNLFPITYAENVLKPDGSAATDAVYYEDVGEQTGAAMSPILHQSDVVDNLTTTSTTAPLSAKQGKLLNDDVTSLRSDLVLYEVSQFAMGNFLGFIVRYGKLRIIEIYNGTDTQVATYIQLGNSDKPTKDVFVKNWMLKDSNTYGSVTLSLNTLGQLSTDATVFRGGFTLVYVAQ